MAKTYSITENVGTARYVVSFHDGIKTHGDGSAFCDIRIFSNKRKARAFVRSLELEGYAAAQR